MPHLFFVVRTQSRRPLWFMAIGGTWLLWLLFAGSKMGQGTSLHDFPAISKTAVKSTYNRTLGFSEIFVAILPERSDQKDTIALMAHYTGIQLTVFDGVSKVVPKAIPSGKASIIMTDGEIGCWRAHLNILRYIVENRIETALILEADVDWDIRLKDQLTSVSDNLPGATEPYPYGLNWMFLWVGHCGHYANPEKLGPVVSYPDPTVNPLKEQWHWIQKDARLYGQEQDGQRLIYRANSPMCTAGYAVTLEGALRVLYAIGHDHLDGPVDLEYGRETRLGRLPGLVLTPPLMSQWKTGSAKDSDIQNVTSETGVRGSGPIIQMSIRKELRALTYAEGLASDWGSSDPTILDRSI